MASQFIAGLVAHGGSVELRPTGDTGLMEYEPDFNLGSQSDVPVGTMGVLAGVTRSRMLLKFDLASSLPAGAEVQSALLHVSLTKAPSGPESVFALHRMLALSSQLRGGKDRKWLIERPWFKKVCTKLTLGAVGLWP